MEKQEFSLDSVSSGEPMKILQQETQPDPIQQPTEGLLCERHWNYRVLILIHTGRAGITTSPHTQGCFTLLPSLTWDENHVLRRWASRRD